MSGDPDTRERLVRAAAEVLWERSYQAASVDELCSRANARKGSFYHYFPSKTDLAIAAIEASWAATKEAVFEPISRSGKGGIDQLRALVEEVERVQAATLAVKGAFLGCPFGNLGQEMAHQDERLREALEAVFEGHRAYIRGALDLATRRGEIPPGDNRQRAENVFALLEGALLVAKVARDPDKFRRVASEIVGVAAR